MSERTAHRPNANAKANLFSAVPPQESVSNSISVNLYVANAANPANNAVLVLSITGHCFISIQSAERVSVRFIAPCNPRFRSRIFSENLSLAASWVDLTRFGDAPCRCAKGMSYAYISKRRHRTLLNEILIHKRVVIYKASAR